MTFTEVIAFLQRQKLGVVATVAADGSPQSAVVGIAVSERGEVVFDTLSDTRKAQNLTRDPRISLTVWEGERTVQLDGRADQPSGAERERLLSVYFAVYPDGRERLKWPGITHVRITPGWARWSDFTTTPAPTLITFSLRDGSWQTTLSPVPR